MSNRPDTEVSTTVVVVVLFVERPPPSVPAWQRGLIWLLRATVIVLLTFF
ncbi:MAG: hypothetical protein OXP28_04400 [Gammaproteobacteria bacterium]|nr:hypothetical protein [Gammaproteobacteria bacterium]MDE2768397.1 hypothetical protein [Chloroflexota bacterium]